MEKDAIRKIYAAKRNSLSHKEQLILSDLMLIQFQNLHLPFLQNILSYKAIAHKNEINLENFEGYLQLINPSIMICYPVADTASNTFQAVPTNSDTEFSINTWGIEEPIENTIIAPADIDLVFVPLLAFDQKGYRVGYGKGFYDRFLSECRADTIKIGFSFFPPEDYITDLHPLDIPLNYGITPEKIYDFS